MIHSSEHSITNTKNNNLNWLHAPRRSRARSHTHAHTHRAVVVVIVVVRAHIPQVGLGVATDAAPPTR